MKKIMLVTLAIAGSLLSTSAFANQSATAQGSPLWTCQLAFSGMAEGVQVFVGRFEIQGEGELNCISIKGETYHSNINLQMKSQPLAPQVAIGKFEVIGQSLNINLFSGEPENIFGKYLIAQAQGAVVAGAGVITGVHADLPELGLTLNLQFLKGFGINVGLSSMKISQN